MVSTHQKCQEMTDEALCLLVSQGVRSAEEVLVVRYNRLVRSCSRPYFLAGGDSEDLIQEGMLGLLSAIREYDPQRDATFRTYAEVCVKRRLASAVRAALRGKHTPLNNSISFETPLLDSGAALDRTHSDRTLRDPEELFLDREAMQEQTDRLYGQLSGFEARILGLYLKGLSYSEIASEVGRTTKSVDNAVQRVRKKLAQQLSSGEFSKG